MMLAKYLSYSLFVVSMRRIHRPLEANAGGEELAGGKFVEHHCMRFF